MHTMPVSESLEKTVLKKFEIIDKQSPVLFQIGPLRRLFERAVVNAVSPVHLVDGTVFSSERFGKNFSGIGGFVVIHGFIKKLVSQNRRLPVSGKFRGADPHGPVHLPSFRVEDAVGHPHLIRRWNDGVIRQFSCEFRMMETGIGRVCRSSIAPRGTGIIHQDRQARFQWKAVRRRSDQTVLKFRKQERTISQSTIMQTKQ